MSHTLFPFNGQLKAPPGKQYLLNQAKNLRQVIAQKPHDVSAINHLAVIYLQLDRLGEAQQLLEKMKLRFPNHTQTLNNLVKVKIALADYNTANLLTTRILKIKPNHPEALYLNGIIHSKQNALPQAVECFRKVIQVDKAFSEAYIALGQCLRQQKKYVEAKNVLEEARSMEPHSVEVIVLLLELLYESGEEDKAQKLYDGLVKDNQSTLEIEHFMQRIQQQLG